MTRNSVFSLKLEPFLDKAHKLH